jgi:hypothetical protein
MAEPMRRQNRRPDGAPWQRLAALGGVLMALSGGVILLLRNTVVTPRTFAPSTPPVLADTKASQPTTYQPEQPKTAFEPTDWRLGPIGLIYIGILVLLVISCFVLIAAYPTALPDAGRALRINPPGPRLQTGPEADLQRFRAEEEQRLNGYYWVDKQKGIVHIPIEQAMQKLARTGIPDFPKGQQ